MTKISKSKIQLLSAADKQRILKYRKIHREKYGAHLIQQEKQEIKIQEKKQIRKKKKQIQNKKNRVSAAKHRQRIKLKILNLQNKVLELQKIIEDLNKKQSVCSHCSNSANSVFVQDNGDNEDNSSQLLVLEFRTQQNFQFIDFSQIQTDSQFYLEPQK